MTQSMDLRRVGIVYRKEILEALRDRRTIISTIVIPIIIFPLIFLTFTGTATVMMQAAQSERIRIAIVGEEYAPELAATIRKTIQAVDPTLPIFDIHTMEEWVSSKVAHPRLNTWLLGSFSVIALVLALVGIYGVVSYSVTQRTQEIGIRLALGARGREVVKMVVRQGMKAVMVGVLCGTIAAAALTRFLAAQLYSVTPTDPVTFASVVMIFIGVALAACCIPAIRAARVDPVEALRYE